jgi:ADP-heptose:LPS heptosyltransferase
MLTQNMLALEGALRRRRAVAPAAVKQVVFLQYRLPLGCCVHLSPVFEAIKRSRPEIQITLATHGLGAQVHRHSRFIDQIIETPDPFTQLLPAAITLRRQLHRREINPDFIFTGASDQRTRISLLGVLASPAWRAGYTLKPVLYQAPLTYDPALSLIDNNLAIARLLGCSEPAEEPQVFFSQRSLDVARTLLRRANPEGRRVVVMVTQNSGGQSTGWHLDRWVRVIQAAHARGCSVVYVGTPADKNAITAIAKAAGDIGYSLAGQTSIAELSAVLALSSAMISLDTGTMHVGRAAGVPMVVLGPSWQKPIEWMPLDVPNVRILRGADRCDIPANYQLDEIESDSVVAALDELLAAYRSTGQDITVRIRHSLSTVDHLAISNAVTVYQTPEREIISTLVS